MPIITDKCKVIEIIESLRDRKVSLAIFCTASHWNTEAILMAANNYAIEKNIEHIPVSVAMTFSYRHMSQAARVTRSGNLQVGFLSIMEHLKLLCDGPYAPYPNVLVLPHLDHADLVRDRWAMTEGLPYLASVMVDAQEYSLSQNTEMTRDYVNRYGSQILVEGIMDELSVQGKLVEHPNENYVDKAIEYIEKTGVDFLVADLGTEQQSSSIGKCIYLKERAIKLTQALGKSMLVLHGTSCLSNDQMQGLADDGIIRVNMWTRIVREAGQYAADCLLGRFKNIVKDDFEASESCRYLFDSTDKASDIMKGTLDLLGYRKLTGRKL